MTRRLARIVVGLGFGDEGKGSMVDYFAQEASLVVRHNGGPQAGHNVVSGLTHHCFSQFGSGAFHRLPTLLSRYMLWNPIALAHEAKTLSRKLGCRALDYHYIDGRAPVITPFHVMANRARPSAKEHGTCGKGIGELASDMIAHPEETIRAADLADGGKTVDLLARIQARKASELGIDVDRDRGEPVCVANAYVEIEKELRIITAQEAEAMIRCSDPIFEGAQGVLLDEGLGFHPHTTWSTTTDRNARVLLKESGFEGDVECVGVIRTYMTRHGNGPFPTEDESLRPLVARDFNCRNAWQGELRVGHFDMVMLRYAELCLDHMDTIALTHADALGDQGLPFCDKYECADGKVPWIIRGGDYDLDGQEKLGRWLKECRPLLRGKATLPELIQNIEWAIGRPVRYVSNGCRLDDKMKC